jgi:N-acetyl-alpha-D-muramate 1-phosphate uridylyltransferase
LDALLFAAGLGTRLRPRTDSVPKALIEVAGVTMLERTARRAIAAGADRLVINVHAHARQIEAFVAVHEGFGVDVVFSHEVERPLETGGGLLHAAPLLRRDAPILLHNTDVITDFPLARLLAAHTAADAMATLAVNRRDASRYLLFDDAGLIGHRDARTGVERRSRDAVGPIQPLAFCGVHVIRPMLPDRITERGAFSIIEVYLRLAAEGGRIAAHDIGSALWLDIGTPTRLADAERRLSS